MDPRKYVLGKREWIRSELSGLYAPLFDELCEALDGTGQMFWAPTSGLRDMATQAALYAQGRTKPGAIVTDAKAGFSPHDWGCATDFAYFDPSFSGQDFWNKADWDLYRDVLAEISGLNWGGNFKSLCDRPHNELKINGNWEAVGQYFVLHGEGATWSFIQSLIS